jgi:hypothetical protein
MVANICPEDSGGRGTFLLASLQLSVPKWSLRCCASWGSVPTHTPLWGYNGEQLLDLPSGSSSLGMPRCVSAIMKASSRFSLFDLIFTLSKSTSSGRIAWMTEWKATPLRQLCPKSFTSIPICLGVTDTENNVTFQRGVSKHCLQSLS